LLIIIPRGNSGSEFIACAEKLAADFSQVKILLFGKNASDRVQGERLKHLLRIPSEVKTVDTLETLVSQLHEASCVLSQRYHGALIAFALRKPLHIVLQGRGDKFSALIPLVETATPEALRTLVQRGEQAFRETLLTLRK
jgi:exopolysaccharide biosynthesis predicted pyruvyltransferase EpsI